MHNQEQSKINCQGEIIFMKHSHMRRDNRVSKRTCLLQEILKDEI